MSKEDYHLRYTRTEINYSNEDLSFNIHNAHNIINISREILLNFIGLMRALYWGSA